MCVSGEFVTIDLSNKIAYYCEQNMDLMVNNLKTSKASAVRSNLMISFADLAVMFNHIVDQRTDDLYFCLEDNDRNVRRTCLMSLIFLVLAGQIKVKGQLGHMAKCLLDEDKHMQTLCQTFFAELSGKDNAVYNNFIDIFSTLSSDECMSDESFKVIFKFLTTLIEKVSSLTG